LLFEFTENKIRFERKTAAPTTQQSLARGQTCHYPRISGGKSRLEKNGSSNQDQLFSYQPINQIKPQVFAKNPLGKKKSGTTIYKSDQKINLVTTSLTTSTASLLFHS